jgi:tyrosine-protein kinase Etk/Wzc
MTSEVPDQQGQDAKTKDAGQDMHLLDWLIIVSRRRRFVFWFTLGAAMLAVIVALIIPSEYTAGTLILPPAQNTSSNSALLGQLGGSAPLATIAGASMGMKNPGDMYVSLFRSRTVEDGVIRRFNLMERYRAKRLSDARRDFEELTTVVLGVKDGLILITVTDKDPKLAAEIANGYVDEFRKLSATLAITEASQRRTFFQQQLLETNENLAAAEEALKHTEQSTGVLQVDSQARSLIESGASLRAQIGMKEVELQGMRSYATEDNPQIVMGEQQLAALKSQLVNLAGADQNPTSDIMLPKGNIPEAGMEYLRRLRDVKYYETISELIARQFEVAKEDEARQGAIIQVADPAIPPDRKSSPHRTIIVLLTTLIAFLTSILWVLVQTRWSQTVHDHDSGPRIQTLREVFRNKQR